MVSLKVKGTTEWTVIPAGTYAAELTAVEPRHDDVNDRDYLLWRWTVTGKSGRTAEIVGVSSQALSPKSKAYGWVRQLLGRELEKDEDIELDDLVGTKCRLVVDLQNRSEGGERNVVTAVFAAEPDSDLPF